MNAKSLAALEEHRRRKREITTAKLKAALARMKTGRTEVLKKGFKWNKAALAAEANVHVNTLLAKGKDGRSVYQLIFDRLKPPQPQKRGAEAVVERLNREFKEIVAQRDNLLERLREEQGKLIQEKEKTLQIIQDKEELMKRLKNAGLT